VWDNFHQFYFFKPTYDTIEEIRKEDGRGHTNSIILGDWNNADVKND
jgi:hypothetical protein